MSLRSYSSIFTVSLKNQLAYMGSYVFRNLFFLIVMFVFFSLWRAIYGEDHTLLGFSLVQTVWYLSFSETIGMSTTYIWSEIQEEVKDGSLAYGLLRPYSYPLFRLFQGLGESFLRLFPMLLMGFLISWAMVGPLPDYFLSFLPVLVLIFLGQASLLLAYIGIGLLAFWMEEVTPVFLLWQKALFILGGLFLPLDFFPAWLRPVVMKTPWAYGIYWPSLAMVKFSWGLWGQVLLGQLVWNGILLLLVMLLYQRARKNVQVQGG